MALIDHKIYNTPEGITELFERVPGNSNEVIIALGADLFNVREIGSFIDAYRHANGNKERFHAAVVDVCETVETPYPDNMPDLEDIAFFIQEAPYPKKGQGAIAIVKPANKETGAEIVPFRIPTSE